jgi:hypothetical protein
MTIKINNQTIDPKVVDLHDGLITTINDKPVPYKRVILRPATIAMDMRAIELSERLVKIDGIPTLKMSEEVYRVAMTMLRIERFECSDATMSPIGHDLIDMSTISRLHPFDMARIEQGILLLDMTESLRFGNITQSQFDAVFKNTEPSQDNAPQHEGEARGTDQVAKKPRRTRPVAGRLDN